MGGGWICASKDLRRLRRDPVAVAVWIGIPVFILLLVYFVFGRRDPKPQGRLLIADEDGTILTALMASAFQREPLGQYSASRRSSAGRATGRWRAGRQRRC